MKKEFFHAKSVLVHEIVLLCEKGFGPYEILFVPCEKMILRREKGSYHVKEIFYMKNGSMQKGFYNGKRSLVIQKGFPMQMIFTMQNILFL